MIFALSTPALTIAMLIYGLIDIFAMPKKYASFFVVFLMMITGVMSLIIYPPIMLNASHETIGKSVHISPKVSGVILSNVPTNGMVSPDLKMNVIVSFNFTNQIGLNTMLSGLQNPFSPDYHKYLTAEEFISKYSPSQNAYFSYVKFFENNGLKVTNIYKDRISISLSGTASQFESVFHTQIKQIRENHETFYAPVKNLSLSVNYAPISAVIGLNSMYSASLDPMFEGSGSYQTQFGSDFQNAYQLSQLYREYGYPTNETIATILWAGKNSAGQSVAPFSPSDIKRYYSNYMPQGEPLPVVYGYPILGAPAASNSSSNDTTGANIESTLDLEMAGSVAPGAKLVEVYGPNATLAVLNEAFAAILNPDYNNSVDAALSHVVAISNSWGVSDVNDTTWMQYEEEAAARGITILASSGDNGNYNGNVDPSFPASMAYDNFGTLAVGGASTLLNGSFSFNGVGTQNIKTEAVWYNSTSPSVGSQGGVSSIFAEPSWQSESSDANYVIVNSSSITKISSGRGTPDIAADADNMAIYITIGITHGLLELSGTSIAAPLMAGAIAVMDHSLGTPEGFINPLIYSYGQEEYAGQFKNFTPFYFISNGSNAVFPAMKGYSLSVGWGSLNTYEFVQAQKKLNFVKFEESGLPNGTSWYVNFSNGLKSGPINSDTFYTSLPNGSYHYNISTSSRAYEPVGENFSLNVRGIKAINVQFKEILSQVRFEVTGLPYGEYFNYGQTGFPADTSWIVNIVGMNSQTTVYSGSNYTYLSNGTYNYVAISSNMSYYAPNGSFEVKGYNVNVRVNFVPVFDSAIGYVNSTLVLLNNSIERGNTENINGFITPGILYDTDNGNIYVTSQGSNTVFVINSRTRAVFKTISVGDAPNTITYNPIANIIYVDNWAAGTISIINGTTNTLTKTIPGIFGSFGIAFSSSNGLIYLDNSLSNTVEAINPSTGKLIVSIPVGTYPAGIYYNVNNNMIYATNSFSRNVSVISTANNSVIATINLGLYPTGGIVYDNINGNMYFTANQFNGSQYPGKAYLVYVKENDTNVTGTIYMGENLSYKGNSEFLTGVAYSPLNDILFVTTTMSSYVIMVNGSNNEIAGNVHVGGGPSGIAFCGISNELYVANTQSNNVSVITTNTSSIVSTIILGTTPNSLGYNPDTMNVYVLGYSSNSYHGNVGILNSSNNDIVASLNISGEDMIYISSLNEIFVASPLGASINSRAAYIYVLNATDNAIISYISIPGIGSANIHMTYDSRSGLVYASITGIMGGSKIAIINVSSNLIVSYISLGVGTWSPYLGIIVYNSINNEIYVEDFDALSDGGTIGIYVINGSTNTVVGMIQGIAEPTGMVVDPSNGELFVSTWTGCLYMINPFTNSISQFLSTGPFSAISSIAIDPSLGYLLITIPFQNSVDIINLKSFELLQSLKVGIYPGGNDFQGILFDQYNGHFYVANTRSGTLSTIAFRSLYVAKFSESNLPYNTTWYVNLSNGMGSGAITGTSHSFPLTNGSYRYAIATSDKIYEPLPSSGSITVLGRNILQPVSFSEINYTVTFTESGLPSGTSWSVTLNGTKESSITDTISFSEPNGSYSYTIGTTLGYSISPTSGNITINGHNINQAISFTPTTKSEINYTVTFTESGLPSGTSWSVTLNGTKESSITDTISFSEPNGSYSYSVSNVTGYSVSTTSGNITINGASTSKTVIFTQINKSTSSSGISDAELYSIIGVVLIAGIIGSALAIIRKKG